MAKNPEVMNREKFDAIVISRVLPPLGQRFRGVFAGDLRIELETAERAGDFCLALYLAPSEKPLYSLPLRMLSNRDDFNVYAETEQIRHLLTHIYFEGAEFSNPDDVEWLRYSADIFASLASLVAESVPRED